MTMNKSINLITKVKSKFTELKELLRPLTKQHNLNGKENNLKI